MLIIDLIQSGKTGDAKFFQVGNPNFILEVPDFLTKCQQIFDLFFG